MVESCRMIRWNTTPSLYTKTMITTVLFDFFDVLCPDDYKAWLQKHGYKKEGDFLVISEQLDHGQITTDQFFSRLAELSGSRVDELRSSFIAEPTIDQEVLAIIKAMRTTHNVGLISNAPSKFLRTILQNHKLEQHFDAIIISSEVGMIKPHPEIFEYALGQLGGKAAETIFIDDNAHYVAGAEAAGLRGIVFTDAQKLRTALRRLGLRLGFDNTQSIPE